MKMKIITILCTSLFAFSFSALADNELDDGPGIFSGEKGVFTLIKTDKNPSNKNKMTSKKLSQTDEFELFKTWKEQKDKNSESYQEFLLWVEYKKVINR